MIAACLKWVDQRPGVDRPNAIEVPDTRFAGVSNADQAALEWALRCGDLTGDDVVAITVGPAAADSVLRDAIACGASRGVRVDEPFDSPSTVVAAAIALCASEARLIWCGDFSIDRGTGSVPSFVAAQLGLTQALGLVGVILGDDLAIDALRRLDGGRREQLSVRGRAVLSVEGATALLRRGSLRRLLSPPDIEVRSCPASANSEVRVVRPYRPRPRVLTGPAGATALDRIKSLTAAATVTTHGELVELAPAAAAERIVRLLREWGYLA